MSRRLFSCRLSWVRRYYPAPAYLPTPHVDIGIQESPASPGEMPAPGDRFQAGMPPARTGNLLVAAERSAEQPHRQLHNPSEKSVHNGVEIAHRRHDRGAGSLKLNLPGSGRVFEHKSHLKTQKRCGAGKGDKRAAPCVGPRRPAAQDLRELLLFGQVNFAINQCAKAQARWLRLLCRAGNLLRRPGTSVSI